MRIKDIQAMRLNPPDLAQKSLPRRPRGPRTRRWRTPCPTCPAKRHRSLWTPRRENVGEDHL